MIYNDLALFTAVARHLSFSEAAQQLNIPLSRVSRRIADLEAHLAVKLFERTTRQVRLTEEGRRLLDRCQEPMEALQDIAGFAEDTARQTIRLTAPPMAVRDRIGPMLISFANAHPQIKLEVTTSNTILDFFRDNIDLAFRVGPLADSSLVARRLWTLHYSFCASPGFLTKHSITGPITRDRLLALPALISRQPWLLTSGEQLKPSNILHEFDTLDLLAGATAADMGVTILPDDMLTHSLVPITVINTTPTNREMYAVYPSRRLLPARVRQLIDFMSKEGREA